MIDLTRLWCAFREDVRDIVTSVYLLPAFLKLMIAGMVFLVVLAGLRPL